MQVTISVGGRFHAFYLAQKLLRQGYLRRLITSYPKFEVARYGIPKDKIDSVIIKEIAERGWRLVPTFIRQRYNPQYFIHEAFDRSASQLFSDGDLCVAWSGFGLYTIRKAKQMGITTIIDEGSSHILYQQMILKEEYEKYGLRPQLAHPKVIERELQEYKEADYIAIPSLFVKRTFIDQGILEDKLIHIPYGVHLSEFIQIPKEDDVFRIIYAGGMTIRKGVHYLLKAHSELRVPNSELLLVGSISNEIRPFFKRYEGNFRWMNHIPQRELYKYYSQGSVFVMMSLEEGLALVQLQAMICGLPVICTSNTGGEDIIRDGVDGFIIPIRNVEALKEKILYLYENPDICREMGQSAKERVSKEFTWDDYGEKMIREYKRVLTKDKVIV